MKKIKKNFLMINGILFVIAIALAIVLIIARVVSISDFFNNLLRVIVIIEVVAIASMTIFLITDKNKGKK